MSTEELIEELRSWAEVEGAGTRAYVLEEAARRLEDLALGCMLNSGFVDNVIMVDGNGKS